MYAPVINHLYSDGKLKEEDAKVKSYTNMT